MEFFSAWLKNIVVVSATVTLLHLLLPSNMGKYVKVITGFVIMLVIVQPFTNVLNTDIYFRDLYLKHDLIIGGASYEKASIPTQGRALSRELAIEVYKEKLAENIEQNIEQDLGIKVDVQLEIYDDMDESNFGTLKKAQVVIIEGERKGLIEKIEQVKIGEDDEKTKEVSKKTVKDINNFFLNFYNLSSENISISRR